jgi:ubiquinone/menaquinone biosynthesis C-methylase UbiE
VRDLDDIGLRKGKRKALHVPGFVTKIEGRGPFGVTVEKLNGGGNLCKLVTDKSVREGPVWIAISPLKREEPTKSERSLVTLDRIKNGSQAEIAIIFRSREGRIKNAELVLDNRGRAKNLEVGESYRFSLLTPREFYSAYERRSIPVNRGARSEPVDVGKKRIDFITRFVDTRDGERVLDCATGIKDYLRSIATKDSRIVCLNISVPMLERTREWLDYAGADFVRYNADLGLPFKENSFDTVILDALLEYTKEPHSVLRNCSALVKMGGKILLLEPVESENISEFYPQDLWELALWRPNHDKDFSKKNFEETLKKKNFELIQRIDFRFSHRIFENEKFSQSVAVFKKVFI